MDKKIIKNWLINNVFDETETSNIVINNMTNIIYQFITHNYSYIIKNKNKPNNPKKPIKPNHKNIINI